MLGELASLVQRLRSGRRDDWNPFGSHLHGNVDEPVALLDGKRRGLGRSAVYQDAMRAVVDLEGDELRISVVVDVTVAKRGDERGNGAPQ